MNKPQTVSVIPQEQPQALAVVTPMEMLNRALTSGADVEMIEKLMVLQERWEAGQARKAFDEAMARAKAAIPPIIRSATGHNSKKYADFAAIASVVDPILGANGLSYRFETEQTDKLITVTCILFGHGHSIPAAALLSELFASPEYLATLDVVREAISEPEYPHDYRGSESESESDATRGGAF